jgi:DNA-binding response OmpR family regulator
LATAEPSAVGEQPGASGPGREAISADRLHLRRLTEEPTRVFTREELLRDVWGHAHCGRTRTLDSHASRLRRRLADAGADGLLRNIWGVGYRLADPFE